MGEGSKGPTIPLRTPPSPSSTQDDELANIAEKHRERYTIPYDAISPERSTSPKELPLDASQGDAPTTDDSTFKGLGNLPLPKTIYTSEDFGTNPLTFTSS